MDLTPHRVKTAPLVAITKAISDHVDEQIVMDNMEREQRDYLGGSRLGVECERALFYEYTNTPKDDGREFSARTLRIFRFGDAIEDLIIAWLRLAGFQLVTEKPNGGQLGFAVARDPDNNDRFRIKGHIDGVVVTTPSHIPLAVPALLEVKSMNAKNFRALVDGGVKKTKHEYFIQIQTYMTYLELFENPALFIAMNKDTSEMYYELVPYDQGAAQAASDKGVRVITATDASQLPRIAKDRTFFKCKWCDYQDRCWAAPDPVTEADVPTERPAWLG